MYMSLTGAELRIRTGSGRMAGFAVLYLGAECAYTGGQGMAGHSPPGSGCRPEVSIASTRARVASISAAVIRAASRRPSSPSRPSRSPLRTSTASGVRGSPAQPHSSVRSLSST